MIATETELRELAQRCVKARTEFVTHVVAYLVANIGFVLIWWFSATDYPWFVWPMLAWGIGIASHAVTLFLGPDTERQEQAIERQLRRLHSRQP